jgi:hypothetical protein
MIVTTQTPRYEGHTVEESGSLLPEADVIDADSTGIKIEHDRELIKVTFDSLATFPSRARLTADEAEHLAQLLIAHAKAARAW